MARVKDAIILCGGIGTRMLPASLYAPKESLPLVDTPVLNHLIWEAAKAGMNRVHIVLSERKKRILLDFLEQGTIHGDQVRTDLPRDSLSMGTGDLQIIPHVQSFAGGIGDAISVAIEQIDGAFLVILGDMLVMDNHVGPKLSGPNHASRASRELVSMFDETGIPCVGVSKVEISEISNYGSVGLDGNRVVEIVEKPLQSEAPSEYVLCGRYLFPENTSKILKEYPVSVHGEMQSIKILNHLISEGGLNAVKFDGMSMYDSGKPLSWLKSQLDHALNRDDLGDELANWIRERMEE